MRSVRYTVYLGRDWQGDHQIYDHTRCIYTALANPTHALVGLDETGVECSGVFFGGGLASASICWSTFKCVFSAHV